MQAATATAATATATATATAGQSEMENRKAAQNASFTITAAQQLLLSTSNCPRYCTCL